MKYLLPHGKHLELTYDIIRKHGFKELLNVQYYGNTIIYFGIFCYIGSNCLSP